MFVRITLPVGVFAIEPTAWCERSPRSSFFWTGGLLISRHAFGSRLRTQRERRGVTLESIVDSTKIKRSLLEALERGDASQWPRGLFRRAYIRDYACAIGLPAEPLVAEFVRLFPEDGSPVSDDVVAAAQEPMRLTFARRARHARAASGRAGGVGPRGAGRRRRARRHRVAGQRMAAAHRVRRRRAGLLPAGERSLTGRVLSPAHLRSILKVHPAGTTQPPVPGRRGTRAAVSRPASGGAVGLARGQRRGRRVPAAPHGGALIATVVDGPCVDGGP